MATNNAINLAKPYPLFFGYYSATTAAITGDGTLFPLAFDTDKFDLGGNLLNGVVTIPTTGKYYIYVTTQLGSLAVGHTSCLLQVGLAGNYLDGGYVNIGAIRDSADTASVSVCGLMDFTAADIVQASITVTGAAKAVTVIGAATYSSYICGYLINS